MVGVDTTFLIELYKGAFLHSNTEKKLEEIEELKNLLIIFDMRIESAKYYGKIYADLKSKGKIAKDRDILIASILLSFGERKIITRSIPLQETVPIVKSLFRKSGTGKFLG